MAHSTSDTGLVYKHSTYSHNAQVSYNDDENHKESAGDY